MNICSYQPIRDFSAPKLNELFKFVFKSVCAANRSITPSTTSALPLPAGTTTVSSLNIPSGAAPTSPVDGDVWRVGAQLFLRDGATTKSITFA